MTRLIYAFLVLDVLLAGAFACEETASRLVAPLTHALSAGAR